LPDHTLIDDASIAAIRRDMLKFAQLQLRDAELVEDAVQEALLAAPPDHSNSLAKPP